MIDSNDASSNPFATPSGKLDGGLHSRPSRWIAAALAAFSAVVFAVFGWFALVLAAFITIVSPELDRQERTQEIIDKLLFRQGGVGAVVLFTLALIAATGLVGTFSFLCTAIFRSPRLRTSFLIACVAGTVLAVAAMVSLVTLG